MQRRTFFGWVGAGVAAAATIGIPAATGTVRAVGSAPVISESAAALESLLGALIARPVGAGYRVSAVSAIDRGAFTVMLSRGEQTAVVRVFRRSATSRGLAQSAIFDLRLMNGADGGVGTNEHVGVAVMTLASRLSRLERTDLRGHARAARRLLSSHDEYLHVHGGTNTVTVA